jgi:hypothetical protein
MGRGAIDVAGEPAQQCRLSGARLAADENELPTAVARRIQGGPECAEGHRPLIELVSVLVTLCDIPLRMLTP